MGKHSDNKSRNNNEPDDDYEFKVLIDKCNVCHSNLDTDHHKLCTHHGETSAAKNLPRVRHYSDPDSTSQKNAFN